MKFHSCGAGGLGPRAAGVGSPEPALHYPGGTCFPGPAFRDGGESAPVTRLRQADVLCILLWSLLSGDANICRFHLSKNICWGTRRIICIPCVPWPRAYAPCCWVASNSRLLLQTSLEFKSGQIPSTRLPRSQELSPNEMYFTTNILIFWIGRQQTILDHVCPESCLWWDPSTVKL